MRNKVTEADFLGSWRLRRTIEDRISGQPGRFEGQARFSPAGEGLLRYEEEGLLRLGSGPPLRATRAYRWAFGEDGVEVSFEDGRPFHSFAGSGGPGADHLCGADLYRVAYDFADWPRWQARWTVRGPRKDYRMTSLYRRS